MSRVNRGQNDDSSPTIRAPFAVGILSLASVIAFAMGAAFGPPRGPDLPSSSDVVAIVAAAGANQVEVVSDELIGDGVLNQSRIIEMRADTNAGKLDILIQHLPVVARMLGRESPDPIDVMATRTETLGEIEVLIRNHSGFNQALAACHGLLVNIQARTNPDYSEEPAFDLIRGVLAQLGC
jgi:hypothetical protein